MIQTITGISTGINVLGGIGMEGGIVCTTKEWKYYSSKMRGRKCKIKSRKATRREVQRKNEGKKLACLVQLEMSQEKKLRGRNKTNKKAKQCLLSMYKVRCVDKSS